MSFMQEALRSYAFLDNMDRQKKNDALVMERDQRDKAMHERQLQQFDQQDRIAGQQEQINSQNLRMNQSKIDSQDVYLMQNKAAAHGDTYQFLSDELTKLDQNGMINVRRFLTDDYRSNFDVMNQVLEGKLNRNSPQALASANDMLSSLVKKGIGKPGRGGVPIVDKRIVGIYPSDDGKNIMLDLEVELEDGTVYNAPVTEGRGTEDDGDNIVRQIPVENLMKHMMGQVLLNDAIDQSGLRNELRGAYNAVKPQFETKSGTRLYKPDNIPLKAADAAIEMFKDQDVGMDGKRMPLEYFEALSQKTHGLPYDKKILKKYAEMEQYPIAESVVDEALDVLDTWRPNIGGIVLPRINKPDYGKLFSKARLVANKQGLDISDKVLKEIVMDRLGITADEKSLETDPALNSNLRKKPDAVSNLLDDHLSESEKKAQSQLFNVEM